MSCARFDGPRLVLVALGAIALACGDGVAPEPVALIKATHPDTVIFRGERIPAALLFEARSAEGDLVTRAGALTLAVNGEGWRVSGDTLIAPDVDAWATVTASANGQSATARVGAVVDLRTRHWVYEYFCDKQRYAAGLHERIDSLKGVMTIDHVAYRGDPGTDPNMTARALSDATARETGYWEGLFTPGGWQPLPPQTGEGAVTWVVYRQVPDTVEDWDNRLVLTQQTPVRYEGTGYGRGCFPRPDRPSVLREQ